jgi:hypothetical protein
MARSTFTSAPDARTSRSPNLSRIGGRCPDDQQPRTRAYPGRTPSSRSPIGTVPATGSSRFAFTVAAMVHGRRDGRWSRRGTVCLWHDGNRSRHTSGSSPSPEQQQRHDHVAGELAASRLQAATSCSGGRCSSDQPPGTAGHGDQPPCSSVLLAPKPIFLSGTTEIWAPKIAIPTRTQRQLWLTVLSGGFFSPTGLRPVRPEPYAGPGEYRNGLATHVLIRPVRGAAP